MRQDDRDQDKKTFFRAGERFFQAGGKWYFAAREGDQGPYPNREAAVVAAHRYMLASSASADTGRKSPAKSNTARKSGAAEGRTRQPLHRHVLGMEQRTTDRPIIPIDD